ncbi:unnamed protein product, partial [Brenthis ino]
MLRSDAETRTEDILFQNINTIDLDIILKVQEDISPDDIISLVFLLYDFPETALQRLIVYQRVSTDIAVNHINLLYEWAVYAQRRPTWKYEFLEALAICRLYNVIRKLGFNVSNIKKHYLPENVHVNIYIDPMKKVLYRLCESMTTKHMTKLKKTLLSYKIDVSNCEATEVLFLELICKKFITLGQYSTDMKTYTNKYEMDQLVGILESFNGLTEFALTIKEIQSQLNNHSNINQQQSSNTLVKKYKSDLNNSGETSKFKKDDFMEMYDILNQLQMGEEPMPNLKSDTQFQNDAYIIKNRNRVGLCCIINQENFYPSKGSIQLHNKINLSDRMGSSHDVIALEKTMKDLNFVVISKSNLGHTEVFQFLKDVIQNKIHPEDSIFMLCILSHGVRGHIYTADSMKIKIQDIQNLLDSDESHKLYGIPKVLIIQACQSEQETEIDTKLVADGPSSYDKYLKKTHFLIYWATAPEYEAFRIENLGSIFIQFLCSRIKQRAKQEDLLNIFTSVTDSVSSVCTELRRAQVPLFESTLRKKLFLYRP